MTNKMKTVTIPIEIAVDDDIAVVTVDRNGTICGHADTLSAKPIMRNKDGLRNEWLLLCGRTIGEIRINYGRGVVNWRETLTEVK